VQVTLQTPAGKIIFIATHLDTSKKPRSASIPLIETLIQTNALPILLAGDLNALPQSPTILALEKTWGNATAQPNLFTYPANQPTRQIDYIFYRPAHRWKTIKSTVLDAPVASDHRPILSIVQLLPSTKGK
jgi:endonuclease/exonuclease/phosphatase family metal-dependent hydrolase